MDQRFTAELIHNVKGSTTRYFNYTWIDLIRELLRLQDFRDFKSINIVLMSSTEKEGE